MNDNDFVWLYIIILLVIGVFGAALDVGVGGWFNTHMAVATFEGGPIALLATFWNGILFLLDMLTFSIPDMPPAIGAVFIAFNLIMGFIAFKSGRGTNS